MTNVVKCLNQDVNPPMVSSADPFVSAWSSAVIRAKGGKSKSVIDPDVWDGFRAVQELKKTGWLAFVQPDDDLMELGSIMMFRYLVREVEIYQEISEAGVKRHQEFDAVVLALHRAEKRFLMERKMTNHEDLKGIFSKLSQIVLEERVLLKKSTQSYWDEAFLATRATRDGWYIDPEEDRPTPLPPEELLEAEKIFQDLKYPRKLMRRYDLDKRFQLRSAAILRRYLVDVSLEAVSSLVALCYLCGDLVTVVGAKVYMDAANRNMDLSEKRILTVDAVYQKLKEEPALKRRRIKQYGTVAGSPRAKKAK
jgi:hypothetical protein